ncbi:hypothetical protein BH10ACT4_BH10ACT4_02560 [soil metagenome]
MATFDQFANQGGAAAGDESEAAAAQAADFGGGPLGALVEPNVAVEPDTADTADVLEEPDAV